MNFITYLIVRTNFLFTETYAGDCIVRQTSLAPPETKMMCILLYIMSQLSNFLEYLTVIGFAFTFPINLFLTIFRIKQIVGTYKYMIITFASLGISFSICEQFARPYVHNYNKGLMFFSLSWIGLRNEIMLIGLVVYAGFYVLVVAFIAVQFVFRYVILINPDWVKKFEGMGVLAWGSYPFWVGLFNGFAIIWFAYPDEFGDEYMR